jgi:hypothetical protein
LKYFTLEVQSSDLCRTGIRENKARCVNELWNTFIVLNIDKFLEKSLENTAAWGRVGGGFDVLRVPAIKSKHRLER